MAKAMLVFEDVEDGSIQVVLESVPPFNDDLTHAQKMCIQAAEIVSKEYDLAEEHVHDEHCNHAMEDANVKPVV